MRISDWSSDVCSSDLPFTQGITAFEKVAFDGRSVRVSPRVGRRCVVADEPDDLLTSRPGVLGGLPLLEKGVLRSDLPFERARMAPQRNARQCGVRQIGRAHV